MDQTRIENPDEVGVSKSVECDTVFVLCCNTHCWLDGGNGIRPVISWVSVCWW